MKATRKITVLLPDALIAKATRASGDNLTATIRRGLEMVAASQSYEAVRKFRGKVKLGINLDKLREDRA